MIGTNDRTEVIEIIWAGPYSLDEVKDNLKSPSDSGVYQIYGTHTVLGPNTLLYIGLTKPPRKFSERVPQHGHFLEWEADDVRIFVGRLGGIKKIENRKDLKQWSDRICRVERLLIFYCSPPYNGNNLKPFNKMVTTTVLNFRKRARLPLVISTLYETSPYAKEDRQWAVYSTPVELR